MFIPPEDFDFKFNLLALLVVVLCAALFVVVAKYLIPISIIGIVILLLMKYIEDKNEDSRHP